MKRMDETHVIQLAFKVSKQHHRPREIRQRHQKEKERRKKAEEEEEEKDVDVVEETFRVRRLASPARTYSEQTAADLTLLLHNTPKMQKNLFKIQEAPTDLQPQNEHLI